MLNILTPLKIKLTISAFLAALFPFFYLFLFDSKVFSHPISFLFLAFFAPIIYLYFLTFASVIKIIFFIDKFFYPLREADIAYEWVFYGSASLLIFLIVLCLTSFFYRWTTQEKNQIKLKKIKEFLRPNQAKMLVFLGILLLLPTMHWLAEIEILFPVGVFFSILAISYETITAFIPAGIIHLLQLIFSNPVLPNTDEEEARMFFYLFHNLIFGFVFHFFFSYFLSCKIFQAKQKRLNKN